MGLFRLIKQGLLVGTATYALAWAGDKYDISFDFPPDFFTKEMVAEGYAPPSKLSIEEFINADGEKAPYLRYDGDYPVLIPICDDGLNIVLGFPKADNSVSRIERIVENDCNRY